MVTASSLATRIDMWDPTSGQSTTELESVDREKRREIVRAEAMALLDKQIGMSGVKSRSAAWSPRRSWTRSAPRWVSRPRRPVRPTSSPVLPAPVRPRWPGCWPSCCLELGVIARGGGGGIRPQLVDQYLGKTAQKTNAVIDKALGALLFIDEAYSLYGKGYADGDAYGEEAVNTLLARLENERRTEDPPRSW